LKKMVVGRGGIENCDKENFACSGPYWGSQVKNISNQASRPVASYAIIKFAFQKGIKQKKG
jgi:hypothetical protein